MDAVASGVMSKVVRSAESRDVASSDLGGVNLSARQG